MQLVRKLLAVLALMALAGRSAQADRVGYDGVVSLFAETDDLRAEHHHDWSPATRDARWKMISTTKDPFSAENTYSYLQVGEKALSAILFRRPVPALSHLWISPNSKYVVGLSNIKLWNPYQIVVFSKAGECLLKRNLVDTDLPGARESVTNWIDWYKKPAPKLEIIENGGMATLLVENPHGSFNRFEFAVTAETSGSSEWRGCQ